MDLRDRFETTDGSRPHASVLSEANANTLTAFAILAGGDAFESLRGRPPPEGAERARAFIEARVEIEAHSAGAEQIELVRKEISQQLSGNLFLVERLMRAKPLRIDLAPPKQRLSSLGYPKAVARHATGIFWDHPEWDRARIAFRQEELGQDVALVVHEMAHAIHYLAFTQKERELIYRVLRPTFGSPAAMDEAFAIYSEREFLETFSPEELRASGVYGFTRRQWSEGHLFTRFVRKLYFPYKPLAGPKMGGGPAGRSRG